MYFLFGEKKERTEIGWRATRKSEFERDLQKHPKKKKEGLSVSRRRSAPVVRSGLEGGGVITTTKGQENSLQTCEREADNNNNSRLTHAFWFTHKNAGIFFLAHSFAAHAAWIDRLMAFGVFML